MDPAEKSRNSRMINGVLQSLSRLLKGIHQSADSTESLSAADKVLDVNCNEAPEVPAASLSRSSTKRSKPSNSSVLLFPTFPGKANDSEIRISGKNNFEITETRTELDLAQDRFSEVQESFRAVLGSIELNAHCVCSGNIFDATVLDCGHVFCRTCLKTWSITSRKRCPVCRLTVTKHYASETIERFMTELDLVKRRHLRILALIKELRAKHGGHFPDLPDMSMPRLTSTAKRDRFRKTLMCLFEVEESKDPEFPIRRTCSYHDLVFPDTIHISRRIKIEEARVSVLCWPWSNEGMRTDILFTLGLLFLTGFQYYMLANRRPKRWTWSEIIAASFIYLWSAVCFAYSIMILQQ